MEDSLLVRYLTHECSDAEADEIQQWVAASPENWQVLERYQRLWRSTPTEPGWDVEAALVAVEAKLRERPPIMLVAMGADTLAARHARRWRVFVKLAAAVSFVAAGIVITDVARSGPPSTVEVAMRTSTTPRGQRAVFRLPDGTDVMLGPESSLRYPENFGRGAREVALTGEASFTVSHDSRRPFTVRAGGMVAIDLGTEFMVTAYPRATDAYVAVRAGRVALRATGAAEHAERILEAGELGRLGPGGEVTVERADTTAQFAWTHGELVLPGIPLRDAAVWLARWYDVEVRLASPEIGTRRLEASFGDEPVADVFQLIAASLRLRVERTGRTYTFQAH